MANVPDTALTANINKALRSIVVRAEPPKTITDSFGGRDKERPNPDHAAWELDRMYGLLALAIREGVNTYMPSKEADWKELAYKLAAKHEFGRGRTGKPATRSTPERKDARLVLLYALEAECAQRKQKGLNDRESTVLEIWSNPRTFRNSTMPDYYKRRTRPLTKSSLRTEISQARRDRDAMHEALKLLIEREGSLVGIGGKMPGLGLLSGTLKKRHK